MVNSEHCASTFYDIKATEFCNCFFFSFVFVRFIFLVVVVEIFSFGWETHGNIVFQMTMMTAFRASQPTLFIRFGVTFGFCIFAVICRYIEWISRANTLSV